MLWASGAEAGRVDFVPAKSRWSQACMRMNRSILVVKLAALVGLAAILAGCATGRNRQQFLQEFTSRGVEPSIYEKIKDNQVLELFEIEHLAAKGVPDSAIISHLKRSRAVYRLTTADVDKLRTAGVSDNVINYMMSTPTRYRGEGYYGYGYHYPAPWYYGPSWYYPYYPPYYPYHYGPGSYMYRVPR